MCFLVYSRCRLPPSSAVDIAVLPAVTWCAQSLCRVQLHNITAAEVEVGLSEYLKYGAGSLKKRTALTPRNIFEKAMLFSEMHLRGVPIGAFTFQQTLLEMLRTG